MAGQRAPLVHNEKGIDMTAPDFSSLDDAGLNLHAVLALAALPAPLRSSLDPEGKYAQLILIGNGGRRLWDTIKAEGTASVASANPIDDFSIRKVEAWLSEQANGVIHEVVYPGDRPIGLQSLGKLAGWHDSSRFMVGINERWGTWFAYRVVVLANTEFELTRPEPGQSPCVTCREKPCVRACPGAAITDARFDLEKCVDYRKQPESTCRATCQSRLACPVRTEHRYSAEQIRHTYSISMQIIERHY